MFQKISFNLTICKILNRFGRNEPPQAPPAKLSESICEALRNALWFLIGFTSLLSSIVSLFMANWSAVWEGISIILVAIFLITIIVAADYDKDKKLIELSKNMKDDYVAVVRGKLGATQSISVWNLVVGDVVLLETGGVVPADCLIIESQDLVIDEPSQINEDDEEVEGERDVQKSKDDPFLLAGSIIIKGQCRAVVCCVGADSTRGIKDKKLETDQDTPVQVKLNNLQKKFIKFASLMVLFVLLIVIVMLVIKFLNKNWYEVVFYETLKYANLLVVLFVVVVPEGLPLTIGVSLAYTTSRMYTEDSILVKKLDAPEKMGQVNEILVGKTNTITTGKMKVNQFFCENKIIYNSRNNTLKNCELSKLTLDLIQESILFNCSARIEMGATTYDPVGNPTEIAFIKFLQDANIPVHLHIKQKVGRIKMISPFNSMKQRSATAMINPSRPDTVSIYLKGAPEVVLGLCTTIRDHDQINELTQERYFKL